MLSSLILQDNGVPIYVQLRDQIAAAIGRSELKPGDRLATMREVAVALSVDLNTVQRAYQALADEGLISTVQGRGSFVAEAPVTRNRESEIQMLAAKVAAQARAQGITPDELAGALRALKEGA